MAQLGFTCRAAGTVKPISASNPLPAIAELRGRAQWVAWQNRVEPGAAKPRKVPINPRTGGLASTTSPSTWGSFDQALARAERDSLDGVGYVLSHDDDLTGIDLDRVIDEDGFLTPWAEELLRCRETYAEVSPSGRGVRLFVRGKVAKALKSDLAQVEIYGLGRYLTVTGDHLDGTPTAIGLAPRTIEMLRARVASIMEAKQKEEAPPPRPRPAVSASVGPDNPRLKTYIEAAIADEITGLATCAEGGRNNQLNKAGYALFQMAAAGWLSEAEATALLEQAAHDCGLVRDDGINSVRATIRSARKGMSQPREVPQDIAEDSDLAALGEAMAEAITRPRDKKDSDQERGETSQASDDPLSGFTFYGEQEKPAAYLVKSLLHHDGITFIGGQSGAGKTFLVCHLAVCLAAKQPFFGRIVKERVGVAIMAAEGAGTLPLRLKVAGEDLAGDEPLPIAFLSNVPNLMASSEVVRLAQRLQALDEKMRREDGVRLGVVVIDTIAAAFDMKDEDSNAEASTAIRRMKKLSDTLGVLVIGVHHFGKDPTTGLRGASAWRAGADTVISVLADRNQITGDVQNREIALAKSRSAEEGPIAPFSLKFVKIGEDEDGEDVGSCIVVPRLNDGVSISSKANWKKKEPRSVISFKFAFTEAIRLSGENQKIMGDGPVCRVVRLMAVRERFMALHVTGEVDKKGADAAARKAWSRLVNNTKSMGFNSGVWSGYEWIWSAV